MVDLPVEPIEFVYFDMGNVLLAFEPQVACQNVARRFDVEFDLVLHAIYQSGLQEQFERGRLTGSRFAESVRERLGRNRVQMPTAELLDAASDMFTPIESMPEALQAVRDSGLRVGLLSNTCVSHWDWIRRQQYPATEFRFDQTVLSFEVGSMKPDPAIYEAAERASGVALNKILLLDDRSENVEGARLRDWRARLCEGGSASWQVLRQHGIVR